MLSVHDVRFEAKLCWYFPFKAKPMSHLLWFFHLYFCFVLLSTACKKIVLIGIFTILVSGFLKQNFVGHPLLHLFVAVVVLVRLAPAARLRFWRRVGKTKCRVAAALVHQLDLLVLFGIFHLCRGEESGTGAIPWRRFVHVANGFAAT